MDKLSHSSPYLDLAGLDQLRTKARQQDDEGLRQVAQQFEGIFVQMLMSSMRDANAAFTADSPFNSQYTRFYEQMRDQQLSVELGAKGALGLAELMVQQLSPSSQGITPASVLRGGLDSQPSPLLPGVTTKAIPLATAATLAPQTAGPSIEMTAPPAEQAVVGMTPTVKTLSPTLPAAKDQSDLVTSTSPWPERGITLPQAPDVRELNAAGQLAVTESQPAESVATFSSQAEFVLRLYPLAQKAARSLGTQPEVLLAQSALETGWGQKMVRRINGEPSNNLFNIKADSRWQGDRASVQTLEFQQGVAVRQRADFRVYDSLDQSFDDFVRFISSDRYQSAREAAHNPEGFIRGLQDAGYATDPAYTDKVMQVLKSVLATRQQERGDE